VNHPLEAALGHGLGSSARKGFALQRCCAVIVALLSHIAMAFLGQTPPDLLLNAANGYVELKFQASALLSYNFPLLIFTLPLACTFYRPRSWSYFLEYKVRPLSVSCINLHLQQSQKNTLVIGQDIDGRYCPCGSHVFVAHWLLIQDR
jgi:hypothetical protein